MNFEIQSKATHNTASLLFYWELNTFVSQRHVFEEKNTPRGVVVPPLLKTLVFFANFD